MLGRSVWLNRQSGRAGVGQMLVQTTEARLKVRWDRRTFRAMVGGILSEPIRQNLWFQRLQMPQIRVICTATWSIFASYGSA